MEGKISGSTRNIIAYATLFLTIAAIIITVIMGQNQDEQYVQDSQRYMAANSNMQQGNYGEAEKDFKNLLSTHPDSYILQWKYAVSLASQNKDKEAIEYFVKTQKQRPFILRNQSYLVQYGEVLYRQGQYAKAKKYLEESKRENKNPQLSAMADSTLKEIEKKLPGQN